MEYFFQLFVIFFFVFLNAFFVAAEFAIVKVRPSQIEQKAAEGIFAAGIAKKILDELDAYLSACQVGITLASLALGWLGEPYLASWLEPLFAQLGIKTQAIIHGLAFGAAFTIITYLHIVLGEMAPKSLSIRLAEKTALWVALPLYAFYKTFKPFIVALNHSALFLIKLVGVNPESESEMAHSEDELKLIFAHSAQSGHLTRREVEMMENVLSLHDKIGKQIMIPRTSVVYLSTTNTFSENLKITQESQHTRYPLCKSDLDQVLGMVHIKDVMAATARGEKRLRMNKLKRDILFYPETITLDALFREFQRTKLHMAVLIDEYGGTIGVATLEDVLEELVGEIYDEFDEPIAFIRQVGGREYLLDGLCPVKLCEERLKIKLPEFDVETVGGVVFSMAGNIPEPGSKLDFENGKIIIEGIDRQRIAKVRVIVEDKSQKIAVEKKS
ncbi:HlyC/CorC family transporter [candidate division KSB1 bacterium]|nr:HlyC/CorC family transporter [candidate division KSB1 bacterium]